MARTRKIAPIHTEAAPGPVTIELFSSYADALATSARAHPIADTILAIDKIDGPAQEQWAADRGGEIQGVLSAIKTRQTERLRPLREIEATIKGYDAETIDLLTRCKQHLAGLLAAARARAAEAQAALLTAAASPAEVQAAVAVLSPSPQHWVETTRWVWQLADDALPKIERRDDGSVALVFSASTLPPDYFVLDESRIGREVAEGKSATKIPGVVVRAEKGGHFRS